MAAKPDIEMLLASLAVEQKNLEKQLAKATGVFDRDTLRMERRAAKMTKAINAEFSKVMNRASVAAAAYGIGRMVSSVTTWGGKMQDVSEQTKVSTDFLQKYGIMAQRGGSSQEALNDGIANFAKNVGLAQMGMPKIKKLFDAIGVKTTGSVEGVFYRVADAVSAAGTQEQKVAIVTKLFGDESRNLVSVLGQGSQALRAQEVQLQRNGLVLDKEGIQKLDELGDTWEDVKRQLTVQLAAPITVGFMDAIQSFSGEIGSDEFKSNLRQFGERLGDIAKWVIKIAPYLPTIAAVWGGAFVGGRVAGVPGAIVGGAIGLGEAKVHLKPNLEYNPRIDAYRQLPSARQAFADAEKDLKYWQDQGWSTNLIAEARRKRDAAAARVAQLEDILKPKREPIKPFHVTQQSIIDAGLVSKPKTKNYKLPTEGDGSKQDHRLQNYLRMEERAAEVARNAGEAYIKTYEAGLDYSAGIADRTAALKFEVETMGMSRDAADRLLVKNEAMAIAAELEARGYGKVAANIRDAAAAYYQTSEAAEKAAITQHRVVSEADSIRDAFTGIAMNDPFERIVDSLKQALIQLEVIDPLIERLFGQRGQPLSGVLGKQMNSAFGGPTLMDSMFKLIPGFADGTPSAPGGVALVGERGPELVNLPRGSEVVPHAPSVALLRGGRSSAIVTIGGANVVVQGNADANTSSMIADRLNAYHTKLARDLPSLIYRAQRDHF